MHDWPPDSVLCAASMGSSHKVFTVLFVHGSILDFIILSKASPAASLTAETSLLLVICQAEDVVLGHDDHGGLVLARPGAGGGCKFVCHEHTVHNALLLGDEVVAGAGGQPSVRHHIRSCYLDLPAKTKVLKSVTIRISIPAAEIHRC